MMSNDDDGVHFALTTRFFFRCSRADHFDPRRFVRANIENDDDDDDDADVSRDEVFALFLSKRRLWGREKTTTRERPSTQKRERRNDDEEEETNRTLFLVCAVTLGRARDADDKEAANINSVYVFY